MAPQSDIEVYEAGKLPGHEWFRLVVLGVVLLVTLFFALAAAYFCYAEVLSEPGERSTSSLKIEGYLEINTEWVGLIVLAVALVCFWKALNAFKEWTHSADVLVQSEGKPHEYVKPIGELTGRERRLRARKEE